MEQKEIQVVNFVNDRHNNYEHVNLDELKRKLDSSYLTPMERRQLQNYYDNCLLAQTHSLKQKTTLLSNSTKVISEQRLAEMKKEKEIRLHAQKIIARLGLIAFLGAAGFVGFKAYHDTNVKPIQILNENYDKIYSEITVKTGENLTSIATQIYNTYPDEVKEIKTVNDVIDEIVFSNHLDDKDDIKSGQSLIIPKQYVEAIEQISEGKTY